MKIRVKSPFFDERGIHKKGEVVEVEAHKFRPEYMESLTEEKIEEKKEKVEKAVKKEPSKTTRKKV